MNYTNLDQRKTAFIFELDDVLYPEKDYLYQVYYLFANLLEYTELIDAKQTTDIMVNAYVKNGAANVFAELKTQLGIDGKFEGNLKHLLTTARLPLKLLLFQKMLALLQDITIDRKKIFVVTDGDPEQQLNKIKQTEWNGLEQYLVVYFTGEGGDKPKADVIDLMIKDHNLQRRELIMIGNKDADLACAETSGIDYLSVGEFL